MIECSRCRNNCPNTMWETEGWNSAEFCEFIVEKIRQMAKTYICNAKIPSDHIEKHLDTIANAKDFWHYEDLFEEGEHSLDADYEETEDESEFWIIFDEMVDELFEV